MKKEQIVEICKKCYDYLISKGFNATVIKIIISMAFGLACAYLLSSCSVSYKYNGVEYQGAIFTPIERGK